MGISALLMSSVCALMRIFTVARYNIQQWRIFSDGENSAMAKIQLWQDTCNLQHSQRGQSAQEYSLTGRSTRKLAYSHLCRFPGRPEHVPTGGNVNGDTNTDADASASACWARECLVFVLKYLRYPAGGALQVTNIGG